MEPTATIVIPTLDIDVAAATAKMARRTAGVTVSIIILEDFKMRGAVKLSNALFKAALHLETPFIAYLNDDTRPTQQNWLKLMIRGLKQDPKFGMAAPSGFCSTPPQRTGKPGDPFKVHVVKRPLAWFAACIRRKTLKSVGLFDEEFIHYGDESDWIQRARRKGWKQIWTEGVYIEHHKTMRSQNPALRNQWAQHDRRVYWRKWGKR